MNRTFATLLNWLDARRARIDCPRFEYCVSSLEGGRHAVDIRNLKVWLYQDRDRRWVAQSLDIWYVASGESAAEAQSRFLRGFSATLVVNLEKLGHIEAFAHPAPPEVWLQWRSAVRRSAAVRGQTVTLEPDDVVPGLTAPTPRLQIAYYGSPA